MKKFFIAIVFVFGPYLASAQQEVRIVENNVETRTIELTINTFSFGRSTEFHRDANRESPQIMVVHPTLVLGDHAPYTNEHYIIHDYPHDGVGFCTFLKFNGFPELIGIPVENSADTRRYSGDVSGKAVDFNNSLREPGTFSTTLAVGNKVLNSITCR
ncbi:MAG TPA: hypothetical protein DCL41_10410 [Bdellovibrionales bacterium]|nr:hypothetical protein [Bdellovibrionales bacterium]|tara:strand:- start:2194 stop:2667 length:474 start_codon:yes stop_codon:yes gene_type:complete